MGLISNNTTIKHSPFVSNQDHGVHSGGFQNPLKSPDTELNKKEFSLPLILDPDTNYKNQ